MIGFIRAISHRLRTRLFSAALLLPLVAFATATSDAVVRCRITGEVMRASCCDGADGAAAKSAPLATVSEADCCERIVRDVTAAPAELSATPSALPDQTTRVARVAFEAPAIELRSSALSSRSEARANLSASLGPPTVRLRLVSKRSFLI